jgi:hypothetical protein
MPRRFVSSRPLLGSALLGLIAFVVFVAICMAAGEGTADSLAGGLFLGVAVGGSLALAHVLHRRQAP